MPRTIALAALPVPELAPPDMVACAAAAGYSHVGLRLLSATTDEPTYPTVGDTPLVQEVERRLAGSGVCVLDVEIFRLKHDTDVRDYMAALETGARLGAQHVLVAGNDPHEGRLIERFAALCDLGAPLNLTMNLEPMPWTDFIAGKNVTGRSADQLAALRARTAATPAGCAQACHSPSSRDIGGGGAEHARVFCNPVRNEVAEDNYPRNVPIVFPMTSITTITVIIS